MSSKKEPETKIETPYETAMKQDKPFVALFYSRFCTYCERFMPIYKNLEDAYENKYNFVMIDAEDPVNQKVVQDYVIGGVPTLYIIDSTFDNRVLINNTIYDDVGKLKVELDRYLKIRAKIH